MKLQELLVDVKTTWVDVPGCPGFKIEVAGLSRKELVALRKSCMTTDFDRKTRQPYERLDDNKFISKFSRAVIKDWTGFKLKYLEEFVLADIEEQDPEAEIDYDEESAEGLVQSSTVFDDWLNEVVFDLDTFRTRAVGDSVEKTEPVAGE